MKKKILTVAAIVASLAVNAQQKQKKLPPPPPPPPTINVSKEIPPPPTPPPAPEKTGFEVYKAFLKRNPQVKDIAWRDKNRVSIELKTGVREEYDLNDAAQQKQVQDRYGELPTPPPPPPPPKAPEPPRVDQQ